MKNLILILFTLIFLASCGSEPSSKKENYAVRGEQPKAVEQEKTYENRTPANIQAETKELLNLKSEIELGIVNLDQAIFNLKR